MICASYKERGEVKACFPHSVMFQWGESDIGKKFKSTCDKKTVEFTVRECQCYDAIHE